MKPATSLLLMLLAFAIGLSAAPAGASAAGMGDSAAAAMIERVNEVRRGYGLRPLRRARSLQRGSKAHSRTLLSAGSLWHASLSSVSARYGRAGEVLAMQPGRGPAIRAAVNAWLSSPPHRAVLLHPGFRRGGAGRSTGSFQGGLATVWVLRTG